MKLVIGGYAQGKLAYVRKKEDGKQCRIYDGTIPEKEQLEETADQENVIIIDHFHAWTREQISRGESPEERAEELMKSPAQIIVISDEIGNGIVPMDAFEREYRERTGRILVKLAEQSDEVVRVVCGIGQRIK